MTKLISTYMCIIFTHSMHIDDHMHSDNVFFYNLGLGAKNNITQNEWTIMTLKSILEKLDHTEVCDVYTVNILL